MDESDLKLQIWMILASFSAGIAQIIDLIPDNLGKLTAFVALIAAAYLVRVNKKNGDKIEAETELRKAEVINMMLKNEAIRKELGK